MSHAVVGNYLNGLGGLVVLALGILVLVPKSRTRAAIAFGVFAMGFGGNYALSHSISIFHLAQGSWRAIATLLINVAWVGGGIAMLITFPKPVMPRERPALAVALLVLAAFVGLSVVDHVAGEGPLLLVVGVLGLGSTGILYALLVVLPTRFLLTEDAELRRQIAVAAGGLALFVGYQAGVGTSFDAGTSVFMTEGPALMRAIARLTVGLAVGLLWLVATLRPERRLARNVALVTLSMVLLGLVAAALDIRGGHGVARVLMTISLAYGILQHRLLGLDVKLRWTISKSTIAAAFIAAFFIASETAQQFFGDTLGSTYVGIAAAGALVFAIAPLQRAAERLAEKAVPVATAHVPDPPVISPVPAQGEASYRNAVRLALRDRRLTRDEEHHLHELARDLGLDGVRAHEILVEVENEPGPSGGVLS